MEPAYSFKSISVHPHHLKQNICGSRAKYRDGRKDTAVKVYTVTQESLYILISNVPAIGGAEDLRGLCDQYGQIEDFKPLDDYPCEDFTEVYLVKYSFFPAARTAKKHLDDKSFLGSTLHVCYAPEFETVTDTRLKLQERRKYIAWKTKTGKNQPNISNQHSDKIVPSKQATGKQTSSHVPCPQPVTYIWAGKEYTEYPKPPLEDVPVQKKQKSSGLFLPRQLLSTPSFAQNLAEASASSKQELESVSRNEIQRPLPHASDSSYQNTISNVRQKISKVSVPNVRVSLKRKRRL